MNGRHTLFVTTAALLASLSIAACDEKPESQPFGSLEITTSSPSAARDVATADGWVVKLDRFLVHVTAVNVTGLDGVPAAAATPQILDQVPQAPKSLVSAAVRSARHWEDVSLQIGPATPDTEILVVAPVTEADRDRMQKEGLSIYVEGRMSRAGVTKTFKWGFTTDTLHKSCEETKNGVVVTGLVVPPNGNDTADVTMSGDVLFSDDLGLPGASLRVEAVVAADGDRDGNITLDELRAVPLDVARAGGAPYAVGAQEEITDLGAFIEELTRHAVTRFRAAGRCTAEPVVASPDTGP